MGRGDLVYVVYWERGCGEDADPKAVFPRMRECLGWLDYEDDRFVRVIFDRVVSASAQAGLAESVAVCRAIPRKDIVDIQQLGVKPKPLGA